MSSCKCCNGCCQCDRLIKSVVINFEGTDYDIQINKTLKEIDCFYPIYLGDAVSTWRYDFNYGNPKYIRGFYKSVKIIIDFQDPAAVTNFDIVECDSSPSVYAMHEKSKTGSQFILFWGDERFLTGAIVLKYRGKKFRLNLGSSILDSEIASFIQTQIHAFGVSNNFPELADTVISVIRQDLTPGSPLITPKTVVSTKSFSQDSKSRCIGGTSPVVLRWNNTSCPFPYIYTTVIGSSVHSTNVCWISPSIPEIVYASSQYTSHILGFYITLVYNGENILITPYINYVDQGQTLEEILINNGYTSGRSFNIEYTAIRTSCASSVIANATGGGCNGGALNVGQTPGNL